MRRLWKWLKGLFARRVVEEEMVEQEPVPSSGLRRERHLRRIEVVRRIVEHEML